MFPSQKWFSVQFKLFWSIGNPQNCFLIHFGLFWAIFCQYWGPQGQFWVPKNPFHGFKQISLDASTPIIFCSCNLNCFDPSEAKKCFFEPFLGYFLAIWGKFGHLGIYFGDVRNPLIGPVRLDWMSLGEKWVPMHCNVPEFWVLSPSAWSFLAPKIITQIGSCGAKISHGYDLGAFIPA